MAFTVSERFPFVSGSEDSRTLSYLAEGNDTVVGTDHDVAAENAIWAAAPETYQTIFVKRKLTNLEELSVIDGKVIYIADVEYSLFEDLTKDPPSPGDVEFSFNIKLQSAKVSHALEHIAKFPGTGFPARTAIAVDENGKAQGFDITVPTETFEYRYTFNNAVLTDEYKKDVEDLVGKQNVAAFAHRAAGEVRLLGFSGGQRNNDDQQVRFEFGVKPNLSNATRYGITGITANGWDIVDPVFSPAKSGGQVIGTPIGVHVLRVFETGDFTKLGLPGVTADPPPPPPP